MGQSSTQLHHARIRPRSLIRFYDKRLATSLRNIFLSHEALFLERGGELRPDLAAKCSSIREFDDAITRVVFGKKLLQPII